MGKNGIAIVEDLWASNSGRYGHKEQRKVYADANLTGLNYLYKFPSRKVSVVCLHIIKDTIMMLGRSTAEPFALLLYQNCFHHT
jgi:hypothetical protein